MADKELLTRPPSAPNRAAVALFDGLPDRYDRLSYLLSFGQDRKWRRALVERVAAGPSGLILDVATGPGGVAFGLRAATGGVVVGIDVTRTMLQRARDNLRRRRETGVELALGRAEELPFVEEAFDAVSSTYLLRYVADPAATVGELVRVLKPGGTLVTLEFHVPPAPAWRALWWLYTRTLLPLLGFALGGREWYEVGRFLGPSISDFYRRHPVTRTLEYFERAGLVGVRTSVFSLGGGIVTWGSKAAGG
jgi:demethylmenaquinone methyltransferase/2-methoxy-6-polyprenyl-1,4-benzoquinol methylase